MKKDIMNLFSLRGVILDTMEVKTNLFLKIRSARNWSKCPHCTKSTQKIHDFRHTKKLHCLAGNNRVFLIIKVRRFHCRKCCRPFVEVMPEWLNGRYRYTKIFEQLVTEALIANSFSEVAKRYGISSPTLLNILKRRQQAVTIPDGDLILNLDEHSFSGRDLKISIAEITHKKILAVLADDNQITMEQYFQTWPIKARNRVLEVCIDMKPSYLTVIKKILPQAKIVIDRFHVMREMIRQVEEMRKIIQGNGRKGERRINKFLLVKNRDHLSASERHKLKLIFQAYKKHPALKGAYFIKEKVHEMYQCQTRATAEHKLNILLSQLEHHEIGKLKEMRDTLIRWKPYILNFFERRTTNAFIEGCHNKIKLIKRLSYGFRNFGNYVLKITLGLMPYLFQIFHNNV